MNYERRTVALRTGATNFVGVLLVFFVRVLCGGVGSRAAQVGDGPASGCRGRLYPATVQGTNRGTARVGAIGDRSGTGADVQIASSLSIQKELAYRNWAVLAWKDGTFEGKKAQLVADRAGPSVAIGMCPDL